MSRQVINTVAVDKSVPLPLWMTCMQPDPTAASGFGPQLGYIPAVVLAYTEPGASKTIAYRLKTSNILFNKIEFTTTADFEGVPSENIPFNSSHVKEILNANKDDWEEANGYLSTAGLLKLEFITSTSKSIYYLPELRIG